MVQLGWCILGMPNPASQCNGRFNSPNNMEMSCYWYHPRCCCRKIKLVPATFLRNKPMIPHKRPTHCRSPNSRTKQTNATVIRLSNIIKYFFLFKGSHPGSNCNNQWKALWSRNSVSSPQLEKSVASSDIKLLIIIKKKFKSHHMMTQLEKKCCF